ncbi:polysaccharide deacetylase family sporulation protein PdaB [Weizmannia acidilactici]|uniref:Polysaccharide deacetylase family sporulation protein PdaB n=1 Tax=Weizmannia acidilactici TaxID=2607726 RepID=A0A5J4JKQ4_9BACI|nr:polysaccharide deacetylase family protein [Weizmannia acidilactici]GER67926.1 polysaccharide deacetylase family sporulation protein PdaB [Weizmannia acidilactici]GER71128.1 polysaccharide deacetylase family sporulation protein PdaB [Weizmannia acidilactici]
MKRFCWILFILLIILSSVHPAKAARKTRNDFEKTGHAFWNLKTDEKMVAITFDDGPDPVYTPQILDTLEKYHAKATFFVIGAHAEENPHIIQREVEEGHEVANHTYHHFSRFAGKKVLAKELAQTSDTIQSISGYRPSLFRPVGGYYNDTIIQTAIKGNYEVILWSWHQDTEDWKRPGADKIARHVISSVRPGDIILLHDAGGDRSQTVKALDTILKFLTKEGYECVTVSEMLYRAKSIIPKFQLFPSD